LLAALLLARLLLLDRPLHLILLLARLLLDRPLHLILLLARLQQYVMIFVQLRIAGLYFATMNQMAMILKQRSGMSKLSTAETLFVGASSRGFIGFILCPITVVKARMEASSRATLPVKVHFRVGAMYTVNKVGLQRVV